MPQWGLHSQMFENTFSFTNMNSEWTPFTLLATLLGGSSATTRKFPPCGSTCLQVLSFMRSGATFLHLCFPSLIVCSVQLESFRKQISHHGHNSQLLMIHKITTLCHTYVSQDLWHIQNEATYIIQYKGLMYHWLLKVK
jgi:hypothetical protein